MLNNEQIKDMEHALGLPEARRKYRYHYHRHGKLYLKSYRNYFQTSKNNENWNDLVNKGLAYKRVVELDQPYYYFHVTDDGIQYLQNTQNYTIKFI